MKLVPFSVFLLLITLFSSRSTSATSDLWAIRGKLSNVTNSLAAVTQLSKNLQQSITWWQLTHAEWHPQALWRYMVLGPPPERTQPNCSWGAQQKLEILKRKGLSATREAAVAEYKTEVGREGTGRIKLTSWVLMYNCLTNECDMVAPVVLVREQATGKLSYGTLWQHLFSSNSSSETIPILLTSSTSDILNSNLTRANSTSSSDKLRLRVAETLGQCNESMAFARSPLDSAYKISPGVCYEMNEMLQKGLNETRLLTILENQPHDSAWNYTRKPMHECSEAPVLMKNLNDIRICVFSKVHNVFFCANFSLTDYNDTSQECRSDRNAIGLSNFLLVYSYLKHEISPEKLNESFQVVYDTVPGAPCNTSGRTKAAIFSSKHNGFDITHSLWEDTNGARMEELEFGRQNGRFCYYGLKNEDKDTESSYLRRCNITKALNSHVERCDQSAVSPELLGVLFSDTVTAYADEHNTAFNMDRGPATDFFTASAALITAAVSVVTATIPCTNLELEYLARYVYPKKHEKLKSLKFAVLALLNVGFGMILYSPIFAMILNEYKRCEAYNTWSLVTSDMIVNIYGTRMRSVFIVEGESVYTSRILWTFIAVCAVSFPLIVLITVKRCYKVFYRRKLLLMERASSYDDAPLSKAEMRELNVKAIEMGSSDYVRLKEQLKQMNPSFK